MKVNVPLASYVMQVMMTEIALCVVTGQPALAKAWQASLDEMTERWGTLPGYEASA